MKWSRIYVSVWVCRMHASVQHLLTPPIKPMPMHPSRCNNGIHFIFETIHIHTDVCICICRVQESSHAPSFHIVNEAIHPVVYYDDSTAAAYIIVLFSKIFFAFGSSFIHSFEYAFPMYTNQSVHTHTQYNRMPGIN